MIDAIEETDRVDGSRSAFVPTNDSGISPSWRPALQSFTGDQAEKTADIDLNPVAAKFAETPETSDYTSIKWRVDHVEAQGMIAALEAASDGSVAGSQAAAGLDESRGSVRSRTVASWIRPVKA